MTQPAPAGRIPYSVLQVSGHVYCGYPSHHMPPSSDEGFYGRGTGFFTYFRTCPAIPGRPGIVQRILSNIFYKSDFETIFETFIMAIRWLYCLKKNVHDLIRGPAPHFSALPFFCFFKEGK